MKFDKQNYYDITRAPYTYTHAVLELQ